MSQARYPELLASSSPSHGYGMETHSNEPPSLEGQLYANNFVKSAQWTADGTTIITNSGDNRLQTFIMPSDLMDAEDEQLYLIPYSQVRCVEAVRALSTYPLFSLQDPSSTLFLCSFPDHPVQLHSALSEKLVASYPLVNDTTEAYISPHSLLFKGDGKSFITGSKALLATFDVSRPGQRPLRLLPTAPSTKRNRARSSSSLKGIISALSIEQASDVLAVGTFSRYVGLYDAAGQGDCLGVFRVDGTDADRRIGGKGITQLIWSPCGRYLYITERYSSGVMVYDIRKTGQLLSWVERRNAETNQRLAVDLSNSTHGGAGLEMWAGGADGKIRMWRNTHCQEGAHLPDLEWCAHNDAVSSTVAHPSGSVIASSSGQWHFKIDQQDSSESDNDSHHSDANDKTTCDSSLKLWSI